MELGARCAGTGTAIDGTSDGDGSSVIAWGRGRRANEQDTIAPVALSNFGGVLAVAFA
jgi:hypothetical protein